MKPAVLSIAVLAVCTVSVSSQWCATYHQLTHVFTRVLLCFSMHVGVKTSVNVVTTVVPYVLPCGTQDISGCVY